MKALDIGPFAQPYDHRFRAELLIEQLADLEALLIFKKANDGIGIGCLEGAQRLQ